MGILSGTRVVELADWVAGPFCASILSDFGAEVIRIDLPGQVVNTRRLHGMEPIDEERSPFFATFAHDKKSVTLDVRTPRGRALLLDLLRKSDVLIEGFRPGTLERWSIGPDVLAETNPGLVLLRISGYGQTGPFSGKPGLDRVAQAFSSATYVTGYPDTPPVRCGLGFADYSTGLWGTIGILLAIIERKSSSRGQVVDQALYESVLPMLCEAPLMYQRHGEVAERTGNRVLGVSPGDAFLTADDRWVHISASGESLWQRLATAMRREDLIADPRFVTMPLRDENNAELVAIIAEWMRKQTADEVLTTLDELGVAAGRIQSVAELMEHPHVVAREDFIRLDDPVFGEMVTYNVLPRLSRTPGTIERTGPRLGEHTDEVLTGVLGLDPEGLAVLRHDGII